MDYFHDTVHLCRIDNDSVMCVYKQNDSSHIHVQNEFYPS